MTPRELIDSGSCTPRCLLATSPASTCKCGGCQSRTHGLLTDVHLDGLIEARRSGYHRLTDSEILGGAA